jgi:hypothetical protein
VYFSQPKSIQRQRKEESEVGDLNDREELNRSFESAKTLHRVPGTVEWVEDQFKDEEKKLLKEFLNKQIYEKKAREQEEKFKKLKEDQDEDERIFREQNEIRRRADLEKEARTPWMRDKDYHSVFHHNVVLSTPKKKSLEHSNIYDDYEETVNNALSEKIWNKTKKKYFNWYPYDTRVGELQRLLELKFQNSQTELKRKFYENIREVKNEIDTKQYNLAKHLQELKNFAQREREEKERLQLEVGRLKKKEHDLKEREELMNSLLRNDMSYKTPPLPKLYNHASDIKIKVDTSGYHTRPINIVDNSKNYYSSNSAVPYYETNDFTMNDPNFSLDEEAEIGDETDRVRKLQNDRLEILQDLSKRKF